MIAKSFRVLVLVGTMLLVGTTYGAGALDLSKARLLFEDDFSANRLGEPPTGWRLNAQYIEVVNDTEAPGGKAVRVIGDETKASTMTVQLATDDPIIVVEHSLRIGKNGPLNFYLDKVDRGSASHNVNWNVDGNANVTYTATRDGRSTVMPVEALKPGWNTIRVVADASGNEAYVFVNDLEFPAIGPVPFRASVDQWGDFVVTLYDTGRREPHRLAETYYGHVKVWSMKSEDVNIVLSPARLNRTSIWAKDRDPKPPMRLMRPEVPLGVSDVDYARVPLTVSERVGISRWRQSVSSGVPLPQGHLFDEDRVRLVDAEGHEIPLQTEVLAWWPDGSIQWVLLTFQIDLEPEELAEVFVEYGNDVRRQGAAAGPIQVRRSGNSLHVDTGPLAWQVFDSTPTLRSSEDGEEDRWTVSGLPQFVLRDGEGNVYTGTPTQISVEEEGAQRVIVRVDGEFIADNVLAPGLFAFDLRLYFYRDRGIVRIDPVITSLKPHQSAHGTATDVAQVSLHFPDWLRGQGHLSYETTAHRSGNGQTFAGTTSSSLSFVQDDHNRLRIVSDTEEVFHGFRSDGWFTFRRDGQAMGVGIRHLWQQFPKAVEVTEDGDLVIHLWPETSEVLTMGGGESKRHELYISFEDHPDVSAWLHPLRAVASPQWYSHTEGLGGPLLVADPDMFPLYDSSVALYESRVQQFFDILLNNRESFREYGWQNFGDWATTWDPNGWGNTEYDMARALFLQFARSGDLAYFDYAEDAARHWMDVDIIWAANNRHWLGGGIEHSTSHRFKAIDAGHAWLQGLVDYYLLTGDRRSLEAARLVGDWFAYLAFERPSGGPRLHNRPGARRPGWALISLMRLAQIGDPYYLEASKAVIKILEEEQTPDGQWTYGIPEAELPGEGRPQLTKGFMTALTLTGLADYERATGDPLAREMLVKGTRFLVERMWSDDRGGFQYIDHPNFAPSPGATSYLFLPGLIHAYELSGEERYLDVARRAFTAATESMSRQPAAANIGRTVAMVMRETPIAMARMFSPGVFSLKPLAESNPVYKGSANTLSVSFTRLEAQDEQRIVLRLSHLPPGLIVKENPVEVVMSRGQSFVNATFELEVTEEVIPGTYSVALEELVTESTVSVTVTVPGWRRVDGFRPPVTNDWFGSLISFSLASEESNGWTHSSGNEKDHYGIPHRRVRQGETEEYLIYEAAGLRDFQFIALIPHDRRDELLNAVEVWVGHSEQKWEKVSLDVTWEIDEELKFAKAQLAPSSSLDGNARFFKVSLSGPGGSHWPQLGILTLEGWTLEE